MKSTLALLCLSLSTLAWAGAAEAAAPISATPKKNSVPKIPKESDRFDASPQKFECLQSCQRPILECLNRCSGDPECPEKCKGAELAQCAETCGMVKKK